jgi:hypothetical protein
MPLNHLSVWGWDGESLEPLRGMKLELLNCGASKVRNLSPLVNMPLKDLTVNYSDVEDISALEGLPLETLLIENTKVKDISVLAKLPVKLLGVLGSPIGDYSPLAAMPELEKLKITYDAKKHEKLLKSCRKLKMINDVPIEEFFRNAGS